MIRAALLLLATLATSAASSVGATAQEPRPPNVAAALTDEQVLITSRFTGARIDVFGVVSDLRETDDILVIVLGPREPVRIVRKERRAGVWVNGAPQRFERVPGYHAAASTRPLAEIEGADAIMNGEMSVTFPSPDDPSPDDETVASDDLDAYRAALVRIRTREGVYRNMPSGVDRFDGGLFRARVLLPPGSPTGVYRAEVFVFRDGQVTSARASELEVIKIGIERFITEAAIEHPMLYGVGCVLLAGVSGWLAGAMFRRR
ncbi:MAG: TIGR02186 family protein [Maricaulaceae bacterium]|jgi:uncharacterized protein (TIGR02186 family)